MKRLIFLFTIALFVMSGCQDKTDTPIPEKPTALSKANLKGKVKSVWLSSTERSYMDEPEFLPVEFTTYTSFGEVEVSTLYNHYGFVMNKDSMAYNNEHLLIYRLEKRYHEDSSGPMFIFESQFDDKGRVLSIIDKANEDVSYQIFSSEYTPKGDLSSQLVAGFGDTVKVVYTYVHDLKDQLIEMNQDHRSLDGDLLHGTRHEYDYNKDGDLIEERTFYDGDYRKTEQKKIYEYQGKTLFQISDYYGDDLSIEEIYNKRGLIVERKQYQNGSLSTEIKYTYTYDHHDNWVERMVAIKYYPDGIGFMPSYIEKRDISYYK